jgi:preprotein translocase subunit SecG
MGGSAGGGGAGMFSARGAASTLTRLTAILAAAFIATSLTLAILAGGGRESDSIFDSAPTEAMPAIPEIPDVSSEPAVPTTE